MNPAYLSAISALAGSLVGGLTTGLTTWMAVRAQTRAGHLEHEVARRQDLFRDFMIVASRAYGNALVSNEPQIQELIDLYAMISRMRVLCSPQMVACADEVMRSITATYFEENRSIRELHDLIKSNLAMDPLKKFSELARDELEGLAALLR
jgi:hypothetical protein